jgi:hypothetical protein
MRNYIKLSALVLAVAFAAACASQKVPAETALKAAETAWAAVSAEATKYMPTEAKGIGDAIAAAKGELAKGNYEAVIKDAGTIPARIADLQKSLEQKKGEWTSAWKTLESTLGSGLTAVQAKVEELTKARKLPAGVEKTAVEGATTALATAQQKFDEAKTAFRDADYEGALAKANGVRADLAKIVTDLKLEMPVLTGEGAALVDAAKQTIQDTMKK